MSILTFWAHFLSEITSPGFAIQEKYSCENGTAGFLRDKWTMDVLLGL